MSKKGGSAPAAPDPYATAGAQSQFNKDTAAYNAALNRINTTTPLGSQTYQMTGTDPTTGAPIYSQNISLSPEGQQLYDLQKQQDLQLGGFSNSLLGQLGSAYANGVNTSGLYGLNGAPQQGNIASGYQGYGPQMSLNTSNLPQLYGNGDLATMRQNAQDALYQNQTRYLDPQFQRGEDQLRTRLYNQGIGEGSEAWKNAMQDFNANKDQAYAAARNDAITGAGNEAAQLFGISSGARGQLYGEALGQGQFANNAAAQASDLAQNQAAFGNAAQAQQYGQALSGAQFGNQARTQGLQELLALRNQPLNEFNALRSSSQVQMPSFQGTYMGGAAAPDYQGAVNTAYQGQINAYNAGQASQNSLMSGLFGLGGSLGGAAITKYSDRRVKTDVVRVGTTAKGIPTYTFRYTWDAADAPVRWGVMAQDVETVIPEAVTEVGGVKQVDYRRVLEAA